MIKNVIFDLGNVLISFKPAEYLDNQEYSTLDKTMILNDIFYSREWLQLDNGDISLAEAITSISKYSSLSKEKIAHIFNLRTDLMTPLHQNADLLPELKKQGYKLYFLSNFPADIFQEIKSGFDFFKYFDGGVISAEVKFSKPDIRIYEVLLNKYSLFPEESLFIDDLEINVKTAVRIGMKGLVTFGSTEISGEVKSALSF